MESLRSRLAISVLGEFSLIQAMLTPFGSLLLDINIGYQLLQLVESGTGRKKKVVAVTPWSDFISHVRLDSIHINAHKDYLLKDRQKHFIGAFLLSSVFSGQESTTSVSIGTSATREPETSSNISCNCTFCMLPVPDDCSVYMMCTNNSAKVIVCGRGLYFNTMAQTCDLEDNLPCENNVQCPESSGRFPYPHSCVHYMDCNNFEITVKICPEGMIFDKDKAECLSGESCEDKFVTSTDSTNNKNSKSFTMDLTQSSTDYVSGSTSSSKTEKINSINDTTIMGTETTFTSKATPITEKNIATDKSNTTSAKINSTVYITTHTATTDFKFTSESVTKTKRIVSTRISDERENDSSRQIKNINTEDISTISTADTFSETEAIRDLSTTMFNKETTNSVSNLSNETINEEESYSTLPEITTVKGISSNDTTEFKCPNRFGLYPDAKNCSKFYHCSHWIAYHKTCPSKLHFSSVLLVCDWPYKAGCSLSSSACPVLYPHFSCLAHTEPLFYCSSVLLQSIKLINSLKLGICDNLSDK
ncbi:Major mite allergen Der p 23 like protein [Argiope bruennichi]|uniref:Major mite allergen Der p 23 like protein n=1 Tax=Argiope bruennichi TaxID=94029 RepID=A0A8T0FK55_ARGBR|nr:Major mite allergen Der p 23 like protein [Argiope bruennichi]